MTINCKGNLVDLSTPKVMGILNLTPDSFYDGGRHTDLSSVLRHTEKMMKEGASFIDVGGYSSRPGAINVSEEEELKRVLPAIEALIAKFPGILLSVDTFRSRVALACLERGAAMINDISAGNLDPEMMHVVAKFNAPYIMMHMKGTPQNMMSQTNYTHLVSDIRYYFSEKIAEARKLGVQDLIVDPGFGFSKTLEQNYSLLNSLELLTFLELPILVGVSRKSMIHKLLKVAPEEALNGSTAIHSVALQKGANILRVHDVKEAVECIEITTALS